MTDPLIRDVSDTSYWIAHLRAQETGRPDALFHDPLAARLAGERGRAIAAGMPAQGVIAWTVVMRTCIIDEFMLRAIRQGVDTVLNLGAGLDTRPYRMDLPASLQWIEADYPHIVEYKDSLLANEQPRCRLERVKIDLADGGKRRKFLSDVNARSGNILVLAEGVVPYLSVEEAAALAEDLRAMDRARFWLVDYFSPDAMKFRRRNKMGKNMQNAPFRFEPPDWFGFFRQHGWESEEIRYLADEGDRRGRPLPLPWPLKAALFAWGLFLSQERKQAMRRFAAYVLLRPSATGARDYRLVARKMRRDQYRQ
jgi:methyltransferase (TIGR00027 family)